MAFQLDDILFPFRIPKDALKNMSFFQRLLGFHDNTSGEGDKIRVQGVRSESFELAVQYVDF